MSIRMMRGWEAKGVTSADGTVSPSLRQKKLSYRRCLQDPSPE